MKRLLATAAAAALVFYLSNQFVLNQARAQTESMPQIQQNTTEVYGKIKQANGNEVVIAVGNMPVAGRGGMNADFADRSGAEGARGDFSAGRRGARDSDAQSDNRRSQRQRASNNSGGEESFGERLQNSEGRLAERVAQGVGISMGGGAAVSSSSLELTGEERTFLIPVTAKITAGSGENERTVRFTQLAYKNTVKLTLNENGGVTAVNVLS